MQNYTYKARDDFGRLIRGTMTAEDDIDLSNRLRNLGYFLTHARVTATAPTKTTAKPVRFSPLEALNFTTQLAISLESGVTLLTSLKDLAESVHNKKIQGVIENISHRVESGCSLKEALAFHPRTFSKLYTSIVGAGESTGKLSFVLNDLARLLEWQMDLRSRIREASIYPTILFFAMIAVVLVLVGWVIPKFEPMFAEMGVSLPLPTRIVLGVSRLFHNYWWILLGSVVLSVVGWIFAGSTKKGRYYIDKFKLKLPILGNLIDKITLSRFCHTFALSLRSGVNVLTSLGIASEVIGNKFLEEVVVKARDYVNVGMKIATSLEVSGQFPTLIIRMISVGEQTGALSETLEKVNQFYDKEVPATIKRMFALFEPMMIVMMGVVVGGIALSVFLPLTQLISAVGD